MVDPFVTHFGFDGGERRPLARLRPEARQQFANFFAIKMNKLFFRAFSGIGESAQ